MEITTAITLSDDVLAAVDELARGGETRSTVIEHVLRTHLPRRPHEPEHAGEQARELDVLNRRADALNAEAADVLDYQVSWPAE